MITCWSSQCGTSNTLSEIPYHWSRLRQLPRLHLVHIKPTQQQVDRMQEGIVLCPPPPLTDNQIWHAYTIHADATIITVSRHGAKWVNNIVVDHLFSRIRPLPNVPCASVMNCDPIFPHQNIQVIFTENRDKQSWVVNGQEAIILSAQNRTIIMCLAEGQRVFVYPVTAIVDNIPVNNYPFTPAYSQTITKSQGQNTKHLEL